MSADFTDYKVRFKPEYIIAQAAEACWKAAPPTRVYTFDVVKLLEVLITEGIDRVFHLTGDRKKAELQIKEFGRTRHWWKKPAWVEFGKKVSLHR